MKNPIQTVAKHLSGVAALWKQDCLHLNTKGQCSLRTDDALDVLLEVKETSSELLFVADLGMDLREHQALRLLHENLFSKNWRYATFARETTKGRVFLRYHYPVEALSEETLSALISNFISTARDARQLVDAIASGKEAGAPIRPQSHNGRLARFAFPQPPSNKHQT